MRRLLAGLWNGAIAGIGGVGGALLAPAVHRGWLYFPFVSEALALIPFSIGFKLRRAVYARLLPAVGTDVVIHTGVVFEDQRTTIGSDVWISVGCYVDYAQIGSSVLIGPYAILLAGGHQHRHERLDVPIKAQGNPAKEPLRIGAGVWIGAGAVVMADVGHDAIIGAGSVVTRAVAPRAVVAGNPARVIRIRTEVPAP